MLEQRVTRCVCPGVQGGRRVPRPTLLAPTPAPWASTGQLLLPRSRRTAGSLGEGDRGTDPAGLGSFTSKAFIKVCNMPTSTHLRHPQAAGEWEGGEAARLRRDAEAQRSARVAGRRGCLSPLQSPFPEQSPAEICILPAGGMGGGLGSPCSTGQAVVLYLECSNI